MPLMALSYYADCKKYGPGDSDEAVKALVNETLDYNPDPLGVGIIKRAEV